MIRSESGLTLIEIIVVLIILGTLIAIIGGRVFQAAGSANQKMNDIKMSKLKDAINSFQLQYRKLPSSLSALVNGETDSSAGFVAIVGEDELLDAWGNPYGYEIVNTRIYRIKSFGADGIEGGTGVDFDAVANGP